MKQNLVKKFILAQENHKKNNLDLAKKLYKEILKIDPKNFETNFMMGSLAGQINDFKSAKNYLKMAVKIQPKNQFAYNNLGNVFKELKDIKKSKICYEKTIKINPLNVNANYNLGLIAQEEKDYKKAILIYEKVIKINSDHANTYHNLGLIFKEIDEFEKAEICFKKILRIHPNSFAALNNLGLTLEEQGKIEDAIIYYKKTIETNPKYSKAYLNYANICKELGKIDEAKELYQKAYNNDPGDMISLYYLTEFKKDILNASLNKKITKIINNKKETKKNIAYGNFIIAKYEQNNKNFKKELQFLIDGHKYFFQSEINRFKNETFFWLKKLPKVKNLYSVENSNKNLTDNLSIKPIFIVGVPRCGSTLIEKIIISGEKNIPAGEETGVLSDVINKKINHEKSVKFDLNKINQELVKKYKKKGLINETNKIFTDKSLENFFYISLIKNIFPYSKIINCKRNPIFSIVSILKNNLTKVSWAHDLNHILEYFNTYFKVMENFKKLYPNFIYELQFEDFIKNPENESQKLFQFCNIPWSLKCLEYYKRKDLISKTASNLQIRQPIQKDKLNENEDYKKFFKKYIDKYSWLSEL